MANSRYNQEKISLSRVERLFAVKETSYGTIVEPANAALFFPTGAVSFKQKPDYREDKQVRNSRSRTARIKGKLPPGQFSFPTYLKPSGAAGVAPVPDLLMEAAFGTKITRAADTVQASPTPTVSAFAAATLANFAVGQPILVAVGTHAELRRITSIDTTIHVAPDLSAAPSSGAAIYSAVGYTLANDLPSISFWRDMGDEVIVYPGCVIDSFNCALNGEDELFATFGGNYQREIHCGTDKLGADIAAAGTATITVLDGTKFDIGARLNISDGTNTETKVIVTGISANVLSVTRGTGAQTWTAASGVDIYPWIPAGTETGNVISGRRGAVHLGGTPVSVIKFDIALANKVKFHDKEKTGSGNDYVESYATPGKRELSGSLSLYMRQKHLGMFKTAANLTAQEGWVPAFAMDANGYPVSGKVFSMMFPQFEIEMPEISEEDGERVLDSAIMPMGSTTGNDEIAIYFI